MWPEIPYLVDDLDGLWELSVERCVLEKGPLVDVPEWTVFQGVLAVVNCHRTLLRDACKVQNVCNHPRNSEKDRKGLEIRDASSYGWKIKQLLKVVWAMDENWSLKQN